MVVLLAHKIIDILHKYNYKFISILLTMDANLILIIIACNSYFDGNCFSLFTKCFYMIVMEILQLIMSTHVLTIKTIQIAHIAIEFHAINCFI